MKRVHFYVGLTLNTSVSIQWKTRSSSLAACTLGPQDCPEMHKLAIFSPPGRYKASLGMSVLLSILKGKDPMLLVLERSRVRAKFEIRLACRVRVEPRSSWAEFELIPVRAGPSSSWSRFHFESSQFHFESSQFHLELSQLIQREAHLIKSGWAKINSASKNQNSYWRKIGLSWPSFWPGSGRVKVDRTGWPSLRKKFLLRFLVVLYFFLNEIFLWTTHLPKLHAHRV